jgi:glutaredoxin-related protein
MMRADPVETFSGFDNKLQIYVTATYFGGCDLHWKPESP